MSPVLASPYLTVAEAVDYLRFPSAAALYQARWRHHLRGFKRGGRLLFRRADLDAFLERDSQELEVFEARATDRHADNVVRLARAR